MYISGRTSMSSMRCGSGASQLAGGCAMATPAFSSSVTKNPAMGGGGVCVLIYNLPTNVQRDLTKHSLHLLTTTQVPNKFALKSADISIELWGVKEGGGGGGVNDTVFTKEQRRYLRL